MVCDWLITSHMTQITRSDWLMKCPISESKVGAAVIVPGTASGPTETATVPATATGSLRDWGGGRGIEGEGGELRA